MFKVFLNDCNKGFQIIFSNGYEISVQYGKMNYCSKTNDNKGENAEIAICKGDANVTSKFANKCNYLGYQSANDFAKLVSRVAKAK